MILPLRQRHLRLVMVLGCFLPAVFALGNPPFMPNSIAGSHEGMT